MTRTGGIEPRRAALTVLRELRRGKPFESADGRAVWIVKRGTGTPTQLFLHEPQRLLTEEWSDISAPEVEAIHPATASDKLLIQVHRARRCETGFSVAAGTGVDVATARNRCACVAG